MRVTYSDDFACPPERLWRFIEEPELQKQWMKGLLENHMTSAGPKGVGSTFRMKLQEGGKTAEYDGKVTAHDRPRRLAIDMWGGNFPAGMMIHVDYRLTEHNGGTRLDYVVDSTMANKLPFWFRLIMPLCGIFMKMQLRGFMKTLKRLSENPESTTSLSPDNSPLSQPHGVRT